MFETMSSFLWFFIPTLTLILVGIAFEEKLIRLENAVVIGAKKTVKEWREERKHELSSNTSL